MLNETWLKNNVIVNDHEIIKDKNFSIFRNDRFKSHIPLTQKIQRNLNNLEVAS